MALYKERVNSKFEQGSMNIWNMLTLGQTEYMDCERKKWIYGLWQELLNIWTMTGTIEYMDGGEWICGLY